MEKKSQKNLNKIESLIDTMLIGLECDKCEYYVTNDVKC